MPPFLLISFRLLSIVFHDVVVASCSILCTHPCLGYAQLLQSVQLKVTQLLHIVAKLSRLAPPAVGIGGSDQLRSWGSFWVAKTVF